MKEEGLKSPARGILLTPIIFDVLCDVKSDYLTSKRNLYRDVTTVHCELMPCDKLGYKRLKELFTA